MLSAPPTPFTTRLLVTIKDACELLSISRTHLYALHRRNEIEIVKIGGSARIRYSELQRLAGVES
jgi:excisionase family DNA binding protein